SNWYTATSVAPITRRRVRFDEPAGRWVVLATVLGSSLAMLDSTVVNVALERIGTDLGADLADLQWTLGGYSLTLASFILLGGSLVDAWSWRLVFLVNLPLAAVVIMVALRHVPESWDPEAGRRLDVPGAVLGALGLAALTYASIAAGKEGASPSVVATGAVGVLALVAFVLVERQSADPLVPPGLFASRQFTVANVITFTIYAAFGAVFFLLALDLQVVAGYSPLAAGMSMVPVTAV